MQKQPFANNIQTEAAVQRCSYEKVYMQKTYRGTPMPKCDFNKVARNSILTNQKHELVVSNCQWNCIYNEWVRDEFISPL